MNVCVAHLQMNACVAKNFGAWTEKVGHPCPTFMAHPTRVGRRVGALHKKLGHPCDKQIAFTRRQDLWLIITEITVSLYIYQRQCKK